MNDLEKKITEYAESYYLGNPQITDAQFDALLDQLREQDPNSEILNSVAWGSSGGLSTRFKSKHYGNSVVSGLDKIKYPEEVHYSSATITPKIDGASVCLYYKNGVPFSLITRGNGYEGMSILHKFPNRFPKINNEALICVRGEAYIPKSKFKELEEKGVPSPRNYVSGIINRDSGIEDPDLKYVEFLFYQLRIFNKKLRSKIEVLQEIKNMGLPTVDFVTTDKTDPQSLKRYYDNHSSFEYPIDGIVITRSVKCSGNDISENSIAYKFESDSVEVVVSDVEWSLGSSGRLNPVVVFEPVSLSGAMISRATGFNYSYILSNKIGKGSIIEITRSNEVIPYIKNVISQSEVVTPIRCPSCGSPLEYDGTFLRCNNLRCSSKFYESFYRVFSLPGMTEGIGGANINKLYELIINKYRISTIPEIFRFFLEYNDKRSLSEEFSGHYLELIDTQIRNVNNYIINDSVTDSDIWYILNIPLVGEILSKKLPRITEAINNTYDQSNYTDRLINVINGYSNDANEILKVINLYDCRVRENVIINNNDKIKVCYTGKTDKFKTRKDFFNHYSDKVVESSVESASYLICNKPSSSSKYKYAMNNGIKIVTEEEFINTIL